MNEPFYNVKMTANLLGPVKMGRAPPPSHININADCVFVFRPRYCVFSIFKIAFLVVNYLNNSKIGYFFGVTVKILFFSLFLPRDAIIIF